MASTIRGRELLLCSSGWTSEAELCHLSSLIANLEQLIHPASCHCTTCHIPTDLLPPATKLGQGNIFSSVCQEFCSQGGSAPLHAGIHPLFQSRHPPLEQTLPRADPPVADPPGVAPPPRWLSASWEIRLTSRWYTSYWNAYLLY